MSKENNELWSKFNNELFDKSEDVGRIIMLKRLVVSTWQMNSKRFKTTHDVLNEIKICLDRCKK